MFIRDLTKFLSSQLLKVQFGIEGRGHRNRAFVLRGWLNRSAYGGQRFSLRTEVFNTTSEWLLNLTETLRTREKGERRLAICDCGEFFGALSLSGEHSPSPAHSPSPVISPPTKEKDTNSQEKLVMIQFPLTLKKQLVDDWEFVTQLGKLVKLPRSPNVDDILKKYHDYRTKKDGLIAESVAEILKGLRCYFDKALPMMLLYKKERQQYQEAVGDNTSPSTVYGAEHLLRLFVKFPELLAYVNMEEGAREILQQKLADFLKFLQKNHSSFFLSTYDVMHPAA